MGNARLPLLLLLCATSALMATMVNGQSDRLVEKEIRLPMDPRYADTPLIDPPKRIAGYFTLNRFGHCLNQGA